MRAFKHSGDLGDLIYALATIKRLGGGMLFLADQPTICKPFTPARYNAIRELILAQPYIAGCEWHRGEPITHDFSTFRAAYDRQRTLLDMQAAWISNKLPPPGEPWLEVENPIRHGRPVIARSPRYHAKEWDLIWPQVLREYSNALFIGLPEEHRAFVAQFGPVDFEPTADFQYMSRIIAGSPIFIGNQSSPLAVAHGINHPVIQETYNRDCLFPRENAKYVRSLAQWESIETQRQRLLLALQFYPGDEMQAQELATLITEIEPKMRDDVDFALVHTREVKSFIAEDIARILRQKFANVSIIRSKRFGTGWPMGPNDLWQDGMRQLQALYRAEKLRATAVFTFEPDCVPLRRDWIDTLKAAWAEAYANGKLVLGHAHNEPKTHINGNAIFDIRILDRIPELIGCSAQTGWDVEHGQALLRHSQDTPFIHQLHRMKDIALDFFCGLRKMGFTPAIFHGVKDCSAIGHARRILCCPERDDYSGDCPIGAHNI